MKWAGRVDIKAVCEQTIECKVNVVVAQAAPLVCPAEGPVQWPQQAADQ